MSVIPYSVLQDLKCGHCRNLLSCGPIYVLPPGNSLCGRCSKIAKKSFRGIAFEALSSHFRYPCMYQNKHCSVILKWGEALDHEGECHYKNFCSILCRHPSALCKAERKLTIGQSDKYAYVSDKALDQLKCGICECYLSASPVFVRDNAQSICHRCIISKGNPLDGSIRHLTYEKLAEKMLFPCIYRNRGCIQYFRFGRDICDHEIECSYGQIVRTPSVKSLSNYQKQRGVIQTHSGHVYGTITPNAISFFAPQSHANQINRFLSVPNDNMPEDKKYMEFRSELRRQQQQRFGLQNKPNGFPNEELHSPTSISNDSTNFSFRRSPSPRFSVSNPNTPNINRNSYQEPNTKFPFNFKPTNLPPDLKIPKIVSPKLPQNEIEKPLYQLPDIPRRHSFHNNNGNVQDLNRNDSFYNNSKLIQELKSRHKLQKINEVENYHSNKETPLVNGWVYDDIANRYKIGN